MLVLAVPHLESNVESLSGLGSLLHDSDVNWHVVKILLDFSSWSDDGDLSGFDSDLD